jgi:DNA-binding MarR family transcriptional regulator
MGTSDGTPRDSDLVDSSQWRPLRLLLTAMDRDIAALYDHVGIPGFRPRFSPALLELARRGPMTIRALAEAVDVTHSAMSQTVAAMRRAGLVSGAPTADARTRAVRLAPKARRLLPFLEAEWRATERTIIELEQEIPYPLTRVVRDIENALGRRSFRDRLGKHLAEHLDEGGM